VDVRGSRPTPTADLDEAVADRRAFLFEGVSWQPGPGRQAAGSEARRAAEFV
jgi:hypothetical protein